MRDTNVQTSDLEGIRSWGCVCSPQFLQETVLFIAGKKLLLLCVCLGVVVVFVLGVLVSLSIYMAVYVYVR